MFLLFQHRRHCVCVCVEWGVRVFTYFNAQFFVLAKNILQSCRTFVSLFVSISQHYSFQTQCLICTVCILQIFWSFVGYLLSLEYFCIWKNFIRIPCNCSVCATRSLCTCLSVALKLTDQLVYLLARTTGNRVSDEWDGAWEISKKNFKKELALWGSDILREGRITERKENAEGRLRDVEDQAFFAGAKICQSSQEHALTAWQRKLVAGW